VKIKRKTRIALRIEERLLVRTRQSAGEIAPTSGPPSGALSGGPVFKYEKKKDLPPCKEE